MNINWREIRTACENAGLPIRGWEEKLPERLLGYLVSHTGADIYDADLRRQMEQMVNLVVSCITDVDPLSEPMLRARAEELGDIFRGEAERHRHD